MEGKLSDKETLRLCGQIARQTHKPNELGSPQAHECRAGRREDTPAITVLLLQRAITPENLEARVGVEPTNSGFADHRLGPLGYRAPVLLCPKPMPRIMPNAPYFCLLSPHSVSATY